MKSHTAKSGFSVIELLVVISILGILASVMLVNAQSTRAKSRDLIRLTEMRSTRQALELYFNEKKKYPDADGDGCSGWDVGNQAHPLFSGQGMDIYFNNGKAPVDPSQGDECNSYRYFRYPAGSYGCPVERGSFYVLGAGNLETTGNPSPVSPGFSCPGRNWQDEFDWVTGGFEN